MIDKKKIEEAAQGAADLYEQDLPIMSYEEDTEVDGQHHFCQEFGAELFKDGVNWAIEQFLKDLWHPIKEKPKKMSIFLYQTVNKEFGMRMIVEERDWKFVVKYQRATRWLYIDDLLPKEGGNHD